MEQRFSWLDATRGIAVLMVVAAHTLDYFWKGYSEFMQVGNAGVVLFFICSGYVIPMSLERLSLRDFWVRRFFRLYPVYWFSIIVFMLTGLSDVEAPLGIVMNLTMLQTYFGAPHVSSLFWSLTVEMGFYLLMTALRLSKIHTQTFLLFAITVVTALLMRIADAAYADHWVYLPLFFLGTIYYRYDAGRYSTRHLAVASVIATAYLLLFPVPWNWRSGWLLALGLFLLLHRNRAAAWPKWLIWCGVVSYSVYLLHGVPLWFGGPLAAPLCFVLAGLTYRLIEQPSIAFGRRLTTSQKPGVVVAAKYQRRTS